MNLGAKKQVKTDRVSASQDGKIVAGTATLMKDDIYRTNGTITEASEKSKNAYASIRNKKNGFAKSLSKLQSQNNLRNSDTSQLLAISIYAPGNLT